MVQKHLATFLVVIFLAFNSIVERVDASDSCANSLRFQSDQDVVTVVNRRLRKSIDQHGTPEFEIQMAELPKTNFDSQNLMAHQWQGILSALESQWKELLLREAKESQKSRIPQSILDVFELRQEMTVALMGYLKSYGAKVIPVRLITNNSQTLGLLLFPKAMGLTQENLQTGTLIFLDLQASPQLNDYHTITNIRVVGRDTAIEFSRAPQSSPTELSSPHDEALLTLLRKNHN
ncbi:MAG: hypothetical protein IT289_04585 [Oligoflexia bacterium]|nr:hypothetical protein [Oligoflexia bacterium]